MLPLASRDLYTIVYDGRCTVCSKLVTRLGQWDRWGALAIIPSQAPSVRDTFPWIPDHAFAESIQVIRALDGETWQGAAAIEQILGILAQGRWISWLFRIPLMSLFAEKFYRWFARNRYHLGCEQHCKSGARDRDNIV